MSGSLVPSFAPDDRYDTSYSATHDDLAHVPESEIKTIHGCQMGNHWDFGFVSSSDESKMWCVTMGTALFVETYSLAILSEASHGRMTVARLWRLAMHERFVKRDMKKSYSGTLGDVDYGPVEPSIEQFPAPAIPPLDDEEVLELAKKHEGDVESLKKVFLDNGFWVWMRPDRQVIRRCNHEYEMLMVCYRFPETETSDFKPSFVVEQDLEVALLGPSLEKLPLEILSSIICQIPSLASVLALGSLSKELRSQIYKYKALPHLWMRAQAPWWDAETKHVVGWSYVKNYAESASARNRKRIWGIVGQIEKLADELGY